jgi:hypothetical protein
VRALAGRCLVSSLSWVPSIERADRYATEAAASTLSTIRNLCTQQQDSSNEFSNVAHYRLKVALVQGIGDVCCASFCATPTVDTTRAFQADLHGARANEMAQQETLVRFLLDLLANNDNGNNPYDDASYVACIVDSLGRLGTGGLVRNVELRSDLWQDTLRQLHHDQLFPTRHGLVGARALVALARLERSQQQKPEAGPDVEAMEVDDLHAASDAPTLPVLDYTSFLLPTSSREMRIAALAALVHVAPVRGMANVLPAIQDLIAQQLRRRDWRTAHDMVCHLTHEITTHQCPRDALQPSGAWREFVWLYTIDPIRALPDRLRCAFYRLYLAMWPSAPTSSEALAEKKSSAHVTSHAAQRRQLAHQELAKCRSQRCF